MFSVLILWCCISISVSVIQDSLYSAVFCLCISDSSWGDTAIIRSWLWTWSSCGNEQEDSLSLQTFFWKRYKDILPALLRNGLHGYYMCICVFVLFLIYFCFVFVAWPWFWHLMRFTSSRLSPSSAVCHDQRSIDKLPLPCTGLHRGWSREFLGEIFRWYHQELMNTFQWIRRDKHNSMLLFSFR